MQRPYLLQRLLAGFLVVMLSGLILSGLIGCSEPEQSAPSTQAAPIMVDVVEVQPWSATISRRLPGVLRPKKRAVLSTRMTGTLETVQVEAGDQVSQGAILVTVESRDVRAAIAAARETHAAAQAGHEQALRTVDRLARLYAEGLIPRQQLEEAQVRKRELAANTRRALSELEAQQVNLDYARLTAPFSGTISDVLVDQGTFVGPGTPVLVLEDRSSLRIDVPISATAGDHLTSQHTYVLLSPVGDDTYPLRFVAVVPAMEGHGVGQRLRLVLERPVAQLRPGQAVTVLARHDGPPKGVRAALPREALIHQGQLSGVMLVRADTNTHFAILRWIQTSELDNGEEGLVPVIKGLEPGDLVVLNPPRELRSGQRVIANMVTP
ncbi:efflux RND transporter periplasmic adaptor subunit [Desulfonatronum thioautotrophicum]|uniref:efflux RND transporter periplasmic adaptor subunit n=1 Tax=Desulfonatronum thioautotrophicum TaxID=617001 RepID=UPI0005EB6F6B|nr:efflux RND transporter periplasmic adaptor subunit [Desulfonatronum thioautotrophicum]